MATTAARSRAAKKKRAPKKKAEQDSPKLLGTGQMQNEAGAVVLGCVGLLTLLALASYHPGDASLKAIRVGKLALIGPVITSTEGRCVAKTR